MSVSGGERGKVARIVKGGHRAVAASDLWCALCSMRQAVRLSVWSGSASVGPRVLSGGV